MATLTIRDFPAALHRRLRDRATTNKRSMEAEVRFILTQTLSEGGTGQRTTSGAVRAKDTSKGFAEQGKRWKGKAKPPEDEFDLLTPKERKVLTPPAQKALQRLREMFGVRNKDPKESWVDELLAERRAEAEKE